MTRIMPAPSAFSRRGVFPWCLLFISLLQMTPVVAEGTGELPSIANLAEQVHHMLDKNYLPTTMDPDQQNNPYWNPSWGSINPREVAGPEILPPDPRNQAIFLPSGNPTPAIWIDNGPFNCRWWEWSSWSPCVPVCNVAGTVGTGQQVRTRSVSYPAVRGGQGCAGPSFQNQSCPIPSCDVDCVWALWGDWSECMDGTNTNTCQSNPSFVNVQSRNRSIAQPVEGNGVNCNAKNAQQQRSCNCPNYCTWSSWSPWSNCSATCGDGTQVRTRTPTQYGQGYYCETSAQDHQLCAVAGCNYTDCEWDTWSNWGLCQAPGFTQRQRKLVWLGDASSCDQSAAIGNATCSCDAYPCAVNINSVVGMMGGITGNGIVGMGSISSQTTTMSFDPSESPLDQDRSLNDTGGQPPQSAILPDPTADMGRASNQTSGQTVLSAKGTQAKSSAASLRLRVVGLLIALRMLR